MTPHSLSISLENTADMLAEALWERWLLHKDNPGVWDWAEPRAFGNAWLVHNQDTRKAIRRTIETLDMILEGDIRSPQDMAAEVEGRVS